MAHLYNYTSINEYLEEVDEYTLSVETDIDGIVVTSPRLNDFNLPPLQQFRFRLNTYENTYKILKKAVKFPTYHGCLSCFKTTVPSYNLCTFANNYLYVCFVLKDGLNEDHNPNLMHNIRKRTHHIFLSLLASCSVNLPLTSSLNLIDTILNHQFQPEYFTIHTTELRQLSNNIAQETATPHFPFHIWFMYAELGQKKKFTQLTSVTADLSNIVNFPSNQCQISVHIGMAIK